MSPRWTCITFITRLEQDSHIEWTHLYGFKIFLNSKQISHLVIFF